VWRCACWCSVGAVSSGQLAAGWCFGASEWVVLPSFNRFGVEIRVVRVSVFVCVWLCECEYYRLIEIEWWRMWLVSFCFVICDWILFFVVLARKIFKYANAVFGMTLLADALFVVLRSKRL
jgi:hypothetical protein